ncbi:uncharacterized protein LOC134464720 [Engraulis encrasicolus]|uniref:uncharacterized protein LOC134464720 n=1 Tax=Engraulis encrasicolus TaxID=184585 RepID=UPI002FCEDB1B
MGGREVGMCRENIFRSKSGSPLKKFADHCVKADCTVDYSSMIIDCATDFSKVVTTMECSITSYIRYEVPYTTSRDGHMSIAIPSGVYINEVYVTVNRSNCLTKEIPVNLTSRNTSRLVNAICEVDQGLKEDPDCNSGVTNQQCIAQKCLITYEVKSTMDTNRTVSMKIPDDVDNVTPILMSDCGKLEVSVTGTIYLLTSCDI